MTAEREPRTGWETDRLDDPADFADSRIPLEDRRYFVTPEDRRYAYCRWCGQVRCACHDEPPTSRLRSYKPGAARSIRNDET